MKSSTYIFLILILSSCINHETLEVRLFGFENQKEIIYEEGETIFLLGFNDYKSYLNEKKINSSFNNSYQCILDYIENSEDNPIKISDSLKLPCSRIDIYETDSIQIILDIYPSDNFRWAIIDFAKKGNLKIYSKKERMLVENIIVDEIQHPNSSTVVLKSESGIEIFEQLRWAR